MDRLAADLNRQFPGLASRIVHREMAIAPTPPARSEHADGRGLWLRADGRGGLADHAGGQPVPRLGVHPVRRELTGAMLGGAEAARAALRALAQDGAGGPADRATGVVLYSGPARPARMNLPCAGRVSLPGDLLYHADPGGRTLVAGPWQRRPHD